MNANRKIQGVAVAVITNALGALILLSPPAADAANCNLKQLCLPYYVCTAMTPQQRLDACNQIADPGCVASNAYCFIATCGMGCAYVPG